MGQVSDVRVRPDVATDWMLRTLLPRLLECAGHRPDAAALRSLTPITSPSQLHDGYSASRTARTLRTVQARLLRRLHSELRWAAGTIAEAAIRRLETGVGYHSDELPHLVELSEFVARHARAGHVGRYLTQCVALTIHVIVLSSQNDDGVISGATPPELRDVYRKSFDALVRTTRPSKRARALKKPRASA